MKSLWLDFRLFVKIIRYEYLKVVRNQFQVQNGIFKNLLEEYEDIVKYIIFFFI